MAAGEERDGVALSNLDQEIGDGLGVTKRELVDYLDTMAARLLPGLAGRALSVVRVRPGQQAFMQKNLPQYAPDWVPTLTFPTQDGRRQVRHPVCGDRRTLLWLANQRAVEYHVPMFPAAEWDRPTALVVDLDPPEGAAFDVVVAAARLVRAALERTGTQAALKTSGAKGVHVVVPLDGSAGVADVAAATRAIAARAERLDPGLATTAFIREDRGGKVFLDATRSGGATVVAVYSPRVRPGLPVSFPLRWDDLDSVTPADLTVATVPGLLGDADPWHDLMPPPQPLDPDLVAEGHTIPVARVQAMHEGKRRARARRTAEGS